MNTPTGPRCAPGERLFCGALPATGYKLTFSRPSADRIDPLSLPIPVPPFSGVKIFDLAMFWVFAPLEPFVMSKCSCWVPMFSCAMEGDIEAGQYILTGKHLVFTSFLLVSIFLIL